MKKFFSLPGLSQLGAAFLSLLLLIEPTGALAQPQGSAVQVTPVRGKSSKQLSVAEQRQALVRAFEDDRKFCERVFPRHIDGKDPRNHQGPTPDEEAELERRKADIYIEDDCHESGPHFSVNADCTACSPTVRRLKLLEALGPSDEGWQMRRFFIDGYLENLEPACHIGPVHNAWILEDALEWARGNQRLYGQTHKQLVDAWLQALLKQVESERQPQEEDELIKCNRAEQVEQRLNKVRALLR